MIIKFQEINFITVQSDYQNGPDGSLLFGECESGPINGQKGEFGSLSDLVRTFPCQWKTHTAANGEQRGNDLEKEERWSGDKNLEQGLCIVD